MKSVEPKVATSQPRNSDGLALNHHPQNDMGEAQYQRWAHCHVNWTAVWIGALATFAIALLVGLVGIALGAHLLDPQYRIVDLKKFALPTLIFSICGAFFSALAGGWIASKIAGILHTEPAMLHGAFVWLLTMPMILACASLGAAGLFGGWYATLNPNSVTNQTVPFIQPAPLGAQATSQEIATYKIQEAEYNRNVKQWREETPQVTRNSALAAVTVLLLGLLGSVIGGWLGSGEPMTFSHYRTRKPIYHTT